MPHELWKLEQRLPRDIARALEALQFGSVNGDGPRVTLKLSFAKDKRPSLTETTTLPNGKSKERVHTPKKFAANRADFETLLLVDKAVIALLRKGMVGFAKSPAAPDLVLWTEIGPPMGDPFVIDEARSAAWLGDWGSIRRVDLRTGAVESIALGDHPAVREMALGGDGTVWALVEHDDSPASHGFRPPAGRKLRCAVAQIAGGALTMRFALSYPRKQHEKVGLCLAVASDGTLLVPHLDGFAHARSDGTVIRTFPAGKMEHWPPRAALSPGGRYIAVTSRPGEIELFDNETGKVKRRSLEMDDALSLVVHDNSTIDVGVATPDWTFVRLSPSGKALHIDGSSSEYATSPDRATVYSSNGNGLIVWKLGKPAFALPIIGGRKGSKMVATKRAVYVRASSGVFQRLSRLAPP